MKRIVYLLVITLLFVSAIHAQQPPACYTDPTIACPIPGNALDENWNFVLIAAYDELVAIYSSWEQIVSTSWSLIFFLLSLF